MTSNTVILTFELPKEFLLRAEARAIHAEMQACVKNHPERLTQEFLIIFEALTRLYNEHPPFDHIGENNCRSENTTTRAAAMDKEDPSLRERRNL